MRPSRRALLSSVVAVVVVGALAGCAPDLTAAVPLGPRAVVRPVVAVVGDSITIGHGLRERQAWPELLAARDGIRVADLGCDGAGVLAEGSDQCSTTEEGLADEAATLHPDVVLLQASSNDLGQDDDALAGADEQLVAEVRRLLPNARIAGLSALWSEQAPPAQLAVISAALRTAVLASGGSWLDLGQPLHGHPDWMQSDDVHPTARGQRAVEAAVVAALGRDHLRV
ncbi:SGNH/GDSL hydrolase family protein [Curtobacterium sp. 'Ferrero']|uniref:SGNH/GDSL hydrolase family protein n=1 Tax=Curtobacterium sp. 'Ferrero' TaxID=2033654 RepID=UPI001596F937|nr:SGNH/GDSL hydrolase family protein [Curtobacterium sp. 'Ferrero']